MRDSPSKEVKSECTMEEQEGGQELHLLCEKILLVAFVTRKKL